MWRQSIDFEEYKKRIMKTEKGFEHEHKPKPQVKPQTQHNHDHGQKARNQYIAAFVGKIIAILLEF